MKKAKSSVFLEEIIEEQNVEKQIIKVIPGSFESRWGTEVPKVRRGRKTTGRRRVCKSRREFIEINEMNFM